MIERVLNYLLSALIGGGVAACIVLVNDRAPKIDSLEVRNLRVTEKIVLHDKTSDRDQVVIESGSILAANKIVATQFLGSQVSGGVLVTNRLYTTPDNLVKTPAMDWKFFTELGGDANGGGGELILRSANGWNGVGTEITDGMLIRFGFDRNESVQMFSQNNETQETTGILMERTRQRPGRFAERFRANGENDKPPGTPPDGPPGQLQRRPGVPPGPPIHALADAPAKEGEKREESANALPVPTGPSRPHAPKRATPAPSVGQAFPPPQPVPPPAPPKPTPPAAPPASPFSSVPEAPPSLGPAFP